MVLKKAGFIVFFIGLFVVLQYGYMMEYYKYLSGLISWKSEKSAQFSSGIKLKRVSPQGGNISFLFPAAQGDWGRVKNAAFGKALASEEKRMRVEFDKLGAIVRKEKKDNKEDISTPAQNSYKRIVSSLKYTAYQINLLKKSEKSLIMGSKSKGPFAKRGAYYSLPVSVPKTIFEEIEMLAQVKKEYKRNWHEIVGDIVLLGENNLALKVEYVFDSVIRKKPVTLKENVLIFFKNGKKHILSFLSTPSDTDGRLLSGEVYSSINYGGPSFGEQGAGMPGLREVHQKLLNETQEFLFGGAFMCFAGLSLLFFYEKRESCCCIA